MAVALQIGVFVIALTITLAASLGLTASLERIGARLRFPEALLGLLAALGADAPEICAALASFYHHYQDVAYGVVLGSNIFNLAGLLGVSAMVAGRIEIGRSGLLLNGGAGLLVTVVAALLLAGWISPWLAALALAALLVPYVALSSMQAAHIRHLRLPARWRAFLEDAVEQAHRNIRRRRSAAPPSWRDPLIALACMAAIIVASATMVTVAVGLAAQWAVPQTVVGFIVLATLTSIPNVATAVELADEGHGVAVVSEALNSNTINIAIGICLPSLAFGLARTSPGSGFSMAWLMAMSVVAIAAASFRNGLHRNGGALLIGLYLIYAVMIVRF